MLILFFFFHFSLLSLVTRIYWLLRRIKKVNIQFSQSLWLKRKVFTRFYFSKIILLIVTKQIERVRLLRFKQFKIKLILNETLLASNFYNCKVYVYVRKRKKCVEVPLFIISFLLCLNVFFKTSSFHPVVQSFNNVNHSVFRLLYNNIE